MAFSTAAGYGNLPNGNFSPIIYSKQVQLAFSKSTVIGDVTTIISERLRIRGIRLRLLKNQKSLLAHMLEAHKSLHKI